jgi:hypothetical protein
MGEKINSHRDLEVYKLAFAAAMGMKADKFCFQPIK